MSVFGLKKGQSAKIIAVNADGAAGERLKSLGFSKGAIVTVSAFSIFNGSVLVICGYNRVGIRKSIAERIEVEPC